MDATSKTTSPRPNSNRQLTLSTTQRRSRNFQPNKPANKDPIPRSISTTLSFPQLLLINPQLGRFGKQHTFSPAARMTLRRRDLASRNLLWHQVASGRPFPGWRWCGDPLCGRERHIFGCPLEIYEPRNKCGSRLPVIEYVKDFAKAMVEKLYPDLEDPRIMARRCLAVQALMDSPPVRSAFWRFAASINMRDIVMTEAKLWKAIYHAGVRFSELMSTCHLDPSNDEIHQFLEAQSENTEDWEIWHAVLRFLLSVEIWRQYGVDDRPDWSFGSLERTGEFLQAMFLNFCIMHQQRCFQVDFYMNHQRWDQLWSEWLDNYPLADYEDDEMEMEMFVLRREVDGDEAVVLKEVGYLGGRGTYIPVWTPPQRKFGEILGEVDDSEDSEGPEESEWSEEE